MPYLSWLSMILRSILRNQCRQIYKNSLIVNCIMLLELKSQNMKNISGLIIPLLFDRFLNSLYVNIWTELPVIQVQACGQINDLNNCQQLLNLPPTPTLFLLALLLPDPLPAPHTFLPPFCGMSVMGEDWIWGIEPFTIYDLAYYELFINFSPRAKWIVTCHSLC